MVVLILMSHSRKAYESLSIHSNENQDKNLIKLFRDLSKEGVG
jgi:hypothetical protein